MKPVGDSIGAGNAGWTFGGAVADTFDSHVEKSIPLYHEGHRLVTQLSDFFVSDESTCYEIGCSTGKLLHSLAEHNRNKAAQFIGFDLEPAMVDKANARCKDFKNASARIEDIITAELEPTDLVVAYYTIQFIKPKARQLVFDKIYNALNWGGAFILFEKVRAPDARFQDISTSLYTDFKIDQGYNDEEILSKTRSLKGVMEPFSTQGNLDLLGRAGFVDVMTVSKYICFEGFLAIK